MEDIRHPKRLLKYRRIENLNQDEH